MYQRGMQLYDKLHLGQMKDNVQSSISILTGHIYQRFKPKGYVYGHIKRDT